MNDMEFIEATLQLASSELRSRFGGNNNAREKKDMSLVTDADFAAEKIILDRINQYFPDDAVISEESGYHRVRREPGQKVWIVDPLDGTSNFANGFPFFSSSIARCQFSAQGTLESLVGGIADPIHEHVYLAEKGRGAFRNGAKISVQSPRPLDRCFLVTGFYYTKGADLDREMERFRVVAQSCQSIRRDGSACLDLAFVASGVYDALWERGLALWDMAAGGLLVTEAGGILRNYPAAKSASLVGRPIDLSYNLEHDGIIAGNQSIVESIFGLLS